MGKDNESIPHRVTMIILVAPQPASVSNTLALGVGLTKSVVSHAQENQISLQVFQTYWVYLSTAVLALISALRPLHPIGERVSLGQVDVSRPDPPSYHPDHRRTSVL